MEETRFRINGNPTEPDLLCTALQLKQDFNKQISVYVRAVRASGLKQEKIKRLVRNLHVYLRAVNACGLNGTFFQQLKLIWISNSGSAITLH